MANKPPRQSQTATSRLEQELDRTETEVQRLKQELKEKEADLHGAEEEIAEQQHEVEQIATIQTELLPTRPPDLPNFKLAASYVAPGDAGGDYYDFLPMRRDGKTASLMMIVADASGHGPAAAVIMAMMHSLLHAFADNHTEPGLVLNDMNGELCSKGLSTAMVTALLLDLEPNSRRLRYACAGHHPPLIRRTDGTVEQLACPRAGLPLSVDPSTPYVTDEVVIAPGEIFLIFSDGATEIKNSAGEEFGLNGLIAAMEEAPAGAAELIRHVNHCIARHREKQSDDKTLLAIESTRR